VLWPCRCRAPAAAHATSGIGQRETRTPRAHIVVGAASRARGLPTSHGSACRWSGSILVHQKRGRAIFSSLPPPKPLSRAGISYDKVECLGHSGQFANSIGAFVTSKNRSISVCYFRGRNCQKSVSCTAQGGPAVGETLNSCVFNTEFWPERLPQRGDSWQPVYPG
jgi:hypothetical protein